MTGEIFIEEYPLKGTLFQFIIYFGFVSVFFEVFRKHQSTIAEILGFCSALFSEHCSFPAHLCGRNDNFYLCIGVCLTSIAFIGFYGTARLNPKYLGKYLVKDNSCYHNIIFGYHYQIYLHDNNR